jgi:TetR/AcrR family hemagglutinin/protease transcriptional regulator
MPPAERRQQLLRAGITSFVENGFGDTKHADLARACQISVPSVFSYFPNREALINAILDEVGGAVITHVIEGAQAVEDPASRLEATATLYANFAAEQPGYAKVWLMWSMHFAPELQRGYQKYETQVINALSEMIVMAGGEEHPKEDTLDRARMILASSAFLAKMVFDGVSEHRLNEFAQNVIQPMQIKRKHQENPNA